MLRAHTSPVRTILLASVLLLSPLCGCGGGSGAHGPSDSSEAGASDAGSPDAGPIIVVDRDAQGGEHPGAEDARAPSMDADATQNDARAPVEDAGDGGWDADPHDGGGDVDSAAFVDALAPETGSPSCPTGTLSCSGVCVPSDVHDCGTCGHDCTNLPHVSGSTGCSASGACVIGSSSCAAGWADCDGNPDDGCETDVTQPGHCGSCTTACPASDPVCSGSGSSYACVTGCPSATQMLCSGSCVDATSSTSDCGACGHACSTSVSGAHAVCVSSACGFACNSGYTGCPASNPTACDDLASDVNNCGACGRACPGPTSGGATGAAACVPAGCTVDCASGFTACPAAPALATTCVDALNDDGNCGGCGQACGNGEHCVSGTCQCTGGQHLCGSPAACVDETVSACGPSCQVCTAPANASASCDGSACQWACNPGYTGCPTANPTACDALGSDSNNCGACGHACTGGETCQSGGCACPAGETLCNETCVNEASDVANCGTCAHSCLGGACSGGQCQPVEMASGATGPITVDQSIDPSNVYFAGGSEIFSCAKSGCGSPTPLLSTAQPAFNLVYDPTVFNRSLWASAEDASAVDQWNLANQSAGTASIPYPTGLGLGANGILYVGTQAGSIMAGATGASGFTSVTTLANDLPGPVSGVASDPYGNVVYGGIELNAGSIVRVPATGGSVETFATNQPNPFAMVIASGNVYWADLGSGSSHFANGAVYMCPTGTSCPSPSQLGGGSYCGSVSTDSTYVYFICSSSLYRCPLAGCGAGPTTLANVGAQQGAQVTNDATAIYFETASGALMKLAK